MLPELGTKEFNDYMANIVRDHDPYRHGYHKLTSEYADSMAVYVSGGSPEKLIKAKRPNEQKEVMDYRLLAYKPSTKADASRVISVIQRVYNPRLSGIEFPKIPGGLADDDDLMKYLTENLPVYGSLMNFIKNVFTARGLEDPNMVLLIEPLEYEIDEMFTPIPKVIKAKDVIDFEDGQYFVLKDENTIIIADTEWIRKFKIGKAKEITLSYEYQHGFGVPPAFRIGGVVKETKQPQWYISFIDGVLPHWDKAVTLSSDLDGAIVNHIYPEKWEFAVDCTNDGCQNGRITYTDGDKQRSSVCPTCHGTSKISTKSPFDVYQISRDALNVDATLPTPPFGYGQKELDSVRFLDEIIAKEIQRGYAAVNMDILDKVGENQSGVAKTIDRQELDSFLQTYANHSFTYIIPNIIYLISKWRYIMIFTDVDAIQPEITPPVTFDVFSINSLTEEMKGFKDSGISRTFVKGIELDIIEKRIVNEQQKARLKAIVNIDVLGGMSNDDIIAMGSTITKEAKYTHIYAEAIVDELIEIDQNYLTLSRVEQRAKAFEFAAKMVTVEIIEPEPDAYIAE